MNGKKAVWTIAVWTTAWMTSVWLNTNGFTQRRTAEPCTGTSFIKSQQIWTDQVFFSLEVHGEAEVAQTSAKLQDNTPCKAWLSSFRITQSSIIRLMKTTRIKFKKFLPITQDLENLKMGIWVNLWKFKKSLCLPSSSWLQCIMSMKTKLVSSAFALEVPWLWIWPELAEKPKLPSLYMVNTQNSMKSLETRGMLNISQKWSDLMIPLFCRKPAQLGWTSSDLTQHKQKWTMNFKFGETASMRFPFIILKRSMKWLQVRLEVKPMLTALPGSVSMNKTAQTPLLTE